VQPELGQSKFCGSWKLYWPDGTPLPHAKCPMAAALKENRPIRGLEAVAERPDGVRVPFLAFATPLFDAQGKLTGAVNMLVDLTERNFADEASQRLAAIVESSDDAILAKDLNGTIIAWNNGAERLFGYTPEEAIGQPVQMLIPPDRQNEVPEILGRIKRGDRIDHYETVRRRKDGSLIDISLSVSPIRSRDGRIIGASKIVRDIPWPLGSPLPDGPARNMPLLGAPRETPGPRSSTPLSSRQTRLRARLPVTSIIWQTCDGFFFAADGGWVSTATGAWAMRKPAKMSADIGISSSCSGAGANLSSGAGAKRLCQSDRS
jgi:PAS domain S-box-containing protein